MYIAQKVVFDRIKISNICILKLHHIGVYESWKKDQYQNLKHTYITYVKIRRIILPFFNGALHFQWVFVILLVKLLAISDGVDGSCSFFVRFVQKWIMSKQHMIWIFHFNSHNSIVEYIYVLTAQNRMKVNIYA